MNVLHRLTLSTVLVLTTCAAFGIDRKSTYPYQRCFEVASQMHRVPLDLLLAVAATESNWDPDARSHANAHGIMQIQWPGTARHLGVRRVSELYNPCLNIELGSRYLRELLDSNGQSEERALASYNYGPTRIAQAAAIPAGARKYVETVARHRQRVMANHGSWLTPGAALELNRFDSRTRAIRYAELMDRRIEHASFVTARQRDGRYAVTMNVTDKGLSTRDTMTLDALGWSEDLR